MRKLVALLTPALAPVTLVLAYAAACSSTNDTGFTSPDGSASGSGSGGSSSGSSSGGSSGSSSGSSGSGSSSSSGSSGADHYVPPPDAPPLFDGGNPFNDASTVAVHVYQTSRNAGQGGAPDHMTDEGTIPASTTPGNASTTINVDLTQPRQQIIGFGAALTEAVGSLLASLPMNVHQQIINDYFGPNGSGYVLSRTHIGSCDFALSAYSLDDSSSPDPSLSNFSIQHDQQYLIPVLKEALAASGGALKILASPWSAPAWMKNNNNLNDGYLLPQNYQVYAQYLSKYLQAYKAAGVPIWGITTQNEATGVGNAREGMTWKDTDMNTFIRDSLGPQLKMDGLSDTQVYFFDHNKGPAGSDMTTWASTIYGDQATNPFVAGEAVHWYGSTFQTYPDALDAVYNTDPSKVILYTEGTADALGDVGYGQSSAGFQYSWMKDDFYWTYDDYDWGWWFASRTDHPIYEPIYRYARDIIVGLNHWYAGWIDWNAVLNRDGGPGHIVNPVPAAIMIDTGNNNTPYYTPLFYAMQQFSKFIRPGSRVVTTTVNTSAMPTDYNGMPTQDGQALLATAAANTDGSVAVVLFNETGSSIDYSISVGSQNASSTIPAQAIQTLVWK